MGENVQVEAGWLALGVAVFNRRLALGMTQTEASRRADVSLRVWGEIERGTRTERRDVTLRAVDSVLQWPTGSCRMIVQGAEPPTPTNHLAELLAAEQRLLTDLALIREAIAEVQENTPPPPEDEALAQDSPAIAV